MSKYKKYNQPLVGIFIRPSLVNKFRNQKPVTKLLGLVKANEILNYTLYFFSIKDVDLKKKTINGTYFDKKNSIWKTRIFPYPNIIYKRHSTSKNRKASTEFFQKQIKKLNIKPLNYFHGFNKWEVYQHLIKEENILPHLPRTVLYTKPDDLNKMFSLSNKLYLKACRSGRGRHVIKLIKMPDETYEWSSYLQKLSIEKIYNFNDLVKKIDGFYGNKNFIIQEAIDLISINKSIVDLRAELQKNARGEIVLAALPVRIGNINAPITTHASCYTFEDFFKNHMQYSHQEIKNLWNRIIETLKIIYQALDKYYGPSGEVGIDIGLDKKGKLWFIECNSQSRKVSFFNAYSQEKIDQSFLNLLEYANFLYQNKDQ